MPILTRFLPSEAALIDMALAFADPRRAPRARLCRRIRLTIFVCLLLLPAYFAGTTIALFKLQFIEHVDVPLFFWIREPAALLLTSTIAREMFHVERFYRRFGL
jgi:hypothetical protein